MKARPMIDRFDSVEHLGPEAIAAFVDGELSPNAAHRARVHLVHCPLCRVEIERQRQASESLRNDASAELRAPTDLIQRLARLEEHCPEGPNADDVGVGLKRGLMDKVEVLYRTIKHLQTGITTDGGSSSARQSKVN